MRFIQLRSAPAQKAGPLPPRTMALTDGSPPMSSNTFLNSEIKESSKAFRTSGRLSVTRATPSFFSTSSILTSCLFASHPKYAELRFLDRRVQRGGDGEAEQAPRVERVDHAVVPEARARVVGMALALVLLADRLLELLFLLLGGEVALDRGEHAGRLLAAHDGDARCRPHPEEARPVGAAAHAVVAGAERAADDQRELRHLGRRDRLHHLRAVLGDAARFVLLADHVAGDVLHEEERDAALRRELDEVRGFERRLGEEDAVVGEDRHRVAVQAGEAGDERGAVVLLDLVELRAVDEARQDLADVVGLACVRGDDAVELLGWIEGLARFGNGERDALPEIQVR